MAVSHDFICILLLCFAMNIHDCEAKLPETPSDKESINTSRQKRNDLYSENDKPFEITQAIHIRELRSDTGHKTRNSDHGLIVDLILPPKLNIKEYSRIPKPSDTHKEKVSLVEKKLARKKCVPTTSSKLEHREKLTRKLNRKARDVENVPLNRYTKRYHHTAMWSTLESFSSPPSFEENKGIYSRKNKSGKGSRNRKQGRKKKVGTLETGKDAGRKVKKVNITDTKSKKKSESKHFSQPYVREGKPSRRLRQHMQHKKKVKQFLQKRIQEQIEERRQRRGLLLGMH